MSMAIEWMCKQKEDFHWEVSALCFPVLSHVILQYFHWWADLMHITAQPSVLVSPLNSHQLYLRHAEGWLCILVRKGSNGVLGKTWREKHFLLWILNKNDLSVLMVVEKFKNHAEHLFCLLLWELEHSYQEKQVFLKVSTYIHYKSLTAFPITDILFSP